MTFFYGTHNVSASAIFDMDKVWMGTSTKLEDES